MADISRLPSPRADVWEWQYQGLCRATGGERFFHPEGERGPARESRDSAAKAVCGRCPVLEACRRHALAAREPYGVWGGMTEDERAEQYVQERRAARKARERGVPVNALTMSIGG